MKIKIFAIVLLTFFYIGYVEATSEKKVSSPNGRNTVIFFLDSDGTPFYQVSRDGNTLVAPSALGFTEKNNVNLTNGFKLKKTSFDSKDEAWTQPWGENKHMREHYNEMALKLKNAKVDLTVRFRAFDDGIGFRYEYNVTETDSLFVMDELTEFNIAEDGISWSIPANADTYEILYTEQLLSSVRDANTPITFKTLSGIYASIHEAGLYDFPEMTLKHKEGTRFKAELTPWPDGVKAKKPNHFTTAWRTLQIGDKAVDLINSGLILNLNPPCKLETTDWIEPMKYIGVWWGMHVGVETWTMGERHGATTENAIKYIDFAYKNGIRGVLFEGWNDGWQNWGGNQRFEYTKPFADFDIEAITRYAREKGVTVIGHHETGGNIPYYEDQMEEAYKWYKNLGIVNVKTGYAGGFPNGLSHHGQYGVNHYQKVVELAASNHMTINAHEPIKDTGIRRTWPNMMSREGARGMEWNGWSEGNPPSHHVMLPFTRLLGGPMDYTPGTFDILLEKSKSSPRHQKWHGLDQGNSRVNTTLAKQLANWVILYSPVQMASDLIDNYEGHPAFQFFRDFDADCDWSKALDGEPGEFVVIVRKAEDKYFLGAATDEEARTIRVKLDFLEPERVYKAIIYADTEKTDWKMNPAEYQIYEKVVTSKDDLDIVMAKGGGQAITFLKMK